MYAAKVLGSLSVSTEFTASVQNHRPTLPAEPSLPRPTLPGPSLFRPSLPASHSTGVDNKDERRFVIRVREVCTRGGTDVCRMTQRRTLISSVYVLMQAFLGRGLQAAWSARESGQCAGRLRMHRLSKALRHSPWFRGIGSILYLFDKSSYIHWYMFICKKC